MFETGEKRDFVKVKKGICKILVCLCLICGILAVFPDKNISGSSLNTVPEEFVQGNVRDKLIRFHVIANSDRAEDQRLKYAVRDEILKKAAPILAKSRSVDESRQMLKDMEADLVRTAERVVREWDKDYPIDFDYGVFSFPTKSYGNIVLPAGEYEAVKIKIGEAAGANWWCVLFPPLCFINVEESTSVQVDGKPGVPINLDQDKDQKPGLEMKYKKNKRISFFLDRFSGFFR